jgi:hypothetical protein
VDNSRLAAYDYDAVMLTVGFPPITDTGQGEWSTTFTTPSFIQVDEFNAPATHEAVGAGPLGKMTLSIERLSRTSDCRSRSMCQPDLAKVAARNA